MADITKCSNEKCKLSKTCHRYVVVANPLYQSYAGFEPIVDEMGNTHCDFYMESNKGYDVTEEPERWILLSIPNGEYKVFASWSGSYFDEDRWRINSGIKSVDEDNNYYYFIGYSGSVYKCKKTYYGRITGYAADIVNEIVENHDILIVDNNDIDDIINTINKRNTTT